MIIIWRRPTLRNIEMCFVIELVPLPDVYSDLLEGKNSKGKYSIRIKDIRNGRLAKPETKRRREKLFLLSPFPFAAN